MNRTGKIFFWTCIIALGFISPVISFGLIILYYLPSIVQELCKTCKEACNETIKQSDCTEDSTKSTYDSEQVTPEMNSFSDDTLEDMK